MVVYVITLFLDLGKNQFINKIRINLCKFREVGWLEGVKMVKMVK